MYNLKSLLLFVLIISSLGTLRAQEFDVVSAVADMSDLRASTNPKLDKKDNPCGMLKISIPSLEGVTFSDNVIDAVYTPGEYLVYVPAKTKSITLKHPNYRPTKISFKEHNLTIESKVSYKIQMAPSSEVFSVQPLIDSKAQYVIFTVEPSNAKLSINGEIMSAQNGMISKLLPVGNYNISIYAPSYHSKEETLVVTKASPLRQNIQLAPMFGWIAVDGDEDSEDATVSLNDSVIGSLPVKSRKLPSGMYTLKVTKPMFKSYEDIVIVNDAETTMEKVCLERNFADVLINVEDGVEVWVNDTIRSIGTWRGRLFSGKQHIVAKKKNYKPEVKDVTIIPGKSLQTIVLKNLQAYEGTLSVCFEKGVDVWLEDQYLGKSPLKKTLPQGVYKLTLRKEGYNDNVTSAIIKDGQVCSVWGKMTLQGRDYWQTDANVNFNLNDVREFKVQSVICIGEVRDSPMNMFDGDPSTSFYIEPFAYHCKNGSLKENLLIGDTNFTKYNNCNLYVVVDCIQRKLNKMTISYSNASYSYPSYAIAFYEPTQNAIQINDIDDISFYSEKVDHTSELLPLNNSNDYFEKGTKTIGIRFVYKNNMPININEMKLFGWPSLSYGDYEPYTDSGFFD